MANGNFYSSFAWQKLRTQRLKIARAADEVCCRCGKHIPWEAKYPHPASASVDHLLPRGLGGEDLPDISELGPAHLDCNASHGGRLGNRKKAEAKAAASVGGGGGSFSEGRVLEPGPASSSPRTTLKPASSSPRTTLKKVRYDHRTITDPYSHPRLETPAPGHVVGTLGDDAIAKINARRGNKPLRPWQEHVFRRMLEVDSNGELVWRKVVVSAPRQVGKSVALSELAIWRCENAPQFDDGPQTVLHISKNLQQARAIMGKQWRWAEDQGFVTRRANGTEAITWPDDSAWLLSSFSAVYGHSASLPIVDEAWALAPEAVNDGLLPVLLERNQPQIVLFSTAHDLCTPLVPQMREAALQDGSVLLLEWSASAEDDPYDPETWIAASPHWSNQRGEIIASQVNSPGFRAQYLNRWPWGEGEAPSGWPLDWSALPRVSPANPPTGLVAAVETDLTGREVGVAFAHISSDATKVDCWVYALANVEAAVELLTQREAFVVFAGKSISDRVAGPFQTISIGQRETAIATPLVAELTRARAVRHNHDEAVRMQTVAARVQAGEHGPVLSAMRSKSAIPAVKAFTWAIWGANKQRHYEAPAIF